MVRLGETEEWMKIQFRFRLRVKIKARLHLLLKRIF